MSRTIKIWVAFLVITIITPIVYKTAYAMPGYLEVLSCLSVIAAVLAVVAIRASGVHFWSLAAALLGLIIGQWWLIQSALVAASMIRPGFGT